MAYNIMVQGTMSNAGKSLLCAALCRIFRQDGLRAAPFKSQNMALNSFITASGGEMGRAQVVQAEAAGIAPDVRMNPILLKPTTDVGSQVIVNGQVLGNMRAMEYYRRKRELLPAVLEAYNSLAAEYDVLVIEGAGSPAEINLKQDDFVNMGLAKLVDAPVLLVGDIDRGGVFAQLYGTVALLEEDERARIKGLIVNKFRGDASILEPGLRQLEALCGIPVAGVVPYTNVDIDDEDSLSERFTKKTARKLLDLAVIRLPRISNFTDFSPFERFDGVSLRYVDRVSELGAPDMILLPGTKSTIADLQWLRQSGLEAAILKEAARGTLIFGVCGGYQMLGQSVSDPGERGSGGRHANPRHGASSHGHGLPRRKGPDADEGRLFRRYGASFRAERSFLYRLRNSHGKKPGAAAAAHRLRQCLRQLCPRRLRRAGCGRRDFAGAVQKARTGRFCPRRVRRSRLQDPTVRSSGRRCARRARYGPRLPRPAPRNLTRKRTRFRQQNRTCLIAQAGPVFRFTQLHKLFSRRNARLFSIACCAQWW